MSVNMESFSIQNTDRMRIKDGFWVPCRICENAFRRIRLTRRYCVECEVGFCEGEHGNFSHQRGRCVQCGPQACEFVEDTPKET